MQQLQKQIIELQAQIAALSSPKRQTPVSNKPAKKKEKDKQKGKPVDKKTPTPKPTSETTSKTDKPKPWSCFNCGEDGHIATSCNDPPNPTLVSAKRTVKRETTSLGERQSSTRQTFKLNPVSIEGQI